MEYTGQRYLLLKSVGCKSWWPVRETVDQFLSRCAHQKEQWSPGRDLNSRSPDFLIERQQSSDIQVRRILGSDLEYGHNHLVFDGCYHRNGHYSQITILSNFPKALDYDAITGEI